MKGRTFPKHCIIQLNSSFETYSKTNGNTSNIKRDEAVNKKAFIPKYVHNFYLPMGSKKGSFKDRNNAKKDCSTTKEPVRLNPSKETLMVALLNQQVKNHINNKETTKYFEKIKVQTSPEITAKMPELENDNILMCNNSKSKEKDKESNKPNLELISYMLTNDLTNIFMKRQDWSFYHKDIVLHDNIRGEKQGIFVFF